MALRVDGLTVYYLHLPQVGDGGSDPASQGESETRVEVREETYLRLDGTSPPIHRTNAQVGIRLDDGNVADYLRFFCFFVRGDDGPFLIVESMDQPEIPKGLTTKERRRLRRHLRPLVLWGRNDDGRFRLTGDVYYSNAVFLADFLVDPGGVVDMVSELGLVFALSQKILGRIR